MYNLIYKQKDLIKAFKEKEVSSIAHQCNTCCGMGAGIAKKIAIEYPITSILDKGFRKFENSIGRCLFIQITNEQSIFNLYAQKDVQYSDTETFSHRFGWLSSSFKEMLMYFENEDTLGIPLIGSGLAAHPFLRNGRTDLEYFKEYIEPIIIERCFAENVYPTITVYYL